MIRAEARKVDQMVQANPTILEILAAYGRRELAADAALSRISGIVAF